MRKIICFLICCGGGLFPQVKAQVNLSNGLVAYYPFNGDANDHSGNNNNPSVNTATPIAGQAGLPNTAYYFNGESSYMQIPNSPTINFGTQFSIFCLIKPMGYNLAACHGNNILEKGADFVPGMYLLRYDDASYTNNQNCYIPQADTLHENIWGYYAGGPVGGYSPFMELNRWYSVVYMSDGKNVSLYINCELIGSAPLPAGINFTNNYDLLIGYLAPPQNPYWLKGIIDEIRMYNRPLTVAEINTLSGCPVSACAPNFTDFGLTQFACNGQSVEFSAAFPDSIQSAQWNLGDGTMVDGSTVNHVYAAPSNYPVKLVVQYKGGCTDSISKTISFTAPVADTSVIRTKDTLICAGDSLTLQAFSNTSGYCWSPSTSLSNPSISDPQAAPINATTYYCTATVAGTNLIYNGDFSKGDTAFSSDYYPVNPENSGAQYYVGSAPATWHPGLGNCGDHTSGSGNMMAVSGLSNFAKVWSQTIQVQPNTNYLFSTWILSLSAQNSATLNFSVNGAILSTNITAPSTTCTWNQFSTIWNSGDSTTVTLSLVSPAGAINGSFFALDDISFAPFNIEFDSVNVSLATYPQLKVRSDTAICGPYNVPLSASGATGYYWSPGVGLTDSTIADPTAQTTQTTQYVVTGYDNPACARKDTVDITVLPLPSFSLTPNSQEICQQSSFTLTAAGGNTYQWSSVVQGQGLSSQNSYSAAGTVTDTFFVTIFNTTCAIGDTLHSVVRVDTIPVLQLSKSNDINCNTGQAQLTATGGNIYTWTPAATLTSANSATPVASPLENTWYTAAAINGVCTGEDSIEVLVSFDASNNRFSVPSAFTPNGDGINDCFKVQYWDAIESFEMSIYNRYGKRVFYSQSPTDCWDGRYGGVDQPAGAYVYEIKATSPCAASSYIFRKGTVVLIR